MLEYEHCSEQYTEIVGNRDIPTQIGIISVDVNPVPLRKELVEAANDFYSDRENLKRKAELRAKRLVLTFGKTPLEDVLLPRFERTLVSRGVAEELKQYNLKSENSSLKRLNQVWASSFPNPYDLDEHIFFFNIPQIIRDHNVKSLNELEDKFRRVWVHERHHFVQAADVGKFYGDMVTDGNLLESLWMLYVIGMPFASGIVGAKTSGMIYNHIEKVLQKPLTRRELFRVGGALGMFFAGGGFGVLTSGKVLHFIQYNLPNTTIEGEAEYITRRTQYSVEDLRRSFHFNAES